MYINTNTYTISNLASITVNPILYVSSKLNSNLVYAIDSLHNLIEYDIGIPSGLVLAPLTSFNLNPNSKPVIL
jgi:hypothetical protein